MVQENFISNVSTGHGKQQNAELSSQQPVGETKVYRCPFLKDDELVSRFYEGVDTLYAAFKRGYSQSEGKGNCLGARKIVNGERNGEYEWITYQQVEERATNLGSGISHLGFPRSSVGIYAANSIEWTLVDLACIRYNQVSVPMYDTFGPEALIHIVNQTDMQVIALTLDKMAALPTLLKSCKMVRLIVILDQQSPVSSESYSIPNVRVISLGELEEIGKSNAKPHILPLPKDVYTISYTSGTTGLPKGAVLTHKNAIATISAGIALSLKGVLPFPLISNEAVHYSYLPMAHIYERLACQFIYTIGGSIGVYSGNVNRLTEDLQLLKPSYLVAVPRILYRIYEKINETLRQKSNLIQSLFRRALATKLQRLHTKNQFTHALWDAIVFRKIRNMLGGNLQCILSAAAPINGEVLDFISVCFCCPVVEGWGMTEAFGGMSCSAPWDGVRQQVGQVCPNIELKLVDCPELNYYSTDKPWPRGEICARGPSIFQGYYKEPGKTVEVFDKDGWFHTGDVGAFDEYDRLHIIDRKKQVFKLSQGEYVAPEKIENIYVRSAFVSQIFVYGDSYENSLVAIVVPNQDALTRHCKEHHITANSYKELLQLASVNALILSTMTTHGKASQLQGFELVRAIYLEAEAFDITRNFLTPTMKLKRPQLKDYYAQNIKDLYQSIKKPIK